MAESLKQKQSLVDAQSKAKSLNEEEVPFLKKEASKVLSKFKNPFK